MKILDVPQSGSIAGSTSSRNRYGQYRRTRANPVQPRTPKQTAVRALLALLSAAWRTVDDKLAWRAWGEQHPRRDSLGQTYTMTAQQSFVSLNARRSAMGLALLDVPPLESQLAFEWAPVLDINTEHAGEEELHLTCGEDVPTSQDKQWLIEATPQTSTGVQFATGWRILTSLTGAAILTPAYVGLRDQLTALFGALVVGKKIWIRVTYCPDGVVKGSQTTSIVWEV